MKRNEARTTRPRDEFKDPYFEPVKEALNKLRALEAREDAQDCEKDKGGCDAGPDRP